MSMISGLSPRSYALVMRDLKALRIPKDARKMILIRTIQQIKNEAKSSASHQRTPEGGAWKPRKQGKQKMLKKIAKLLNTRGESNKARAYYTNKRTAFIALAHQEGLDQVQKKNDVKGEQPKNEGKATLQQAKKLKDLGYSRKKGKRWRPVSVAEIRATLSSAQAGVIIRKMQTTGYIAKGLSEWVIKTEKRPFLNDDEQHNIEILEKYLNKYFSGQDL